MSVNEKMTAIADAIRDNHVEELGKLGLDEMPARIREACEQEYDRGYGDAEGSARDQGYSEGYDAGVTDGKQAEYDHFWNAFQQNGNRTDYKNAFYGYSSNPDTLYPKYDIKPIGDASNMFSSWTAGIATNCGPFDLATRLEECGVYLDTGGVTNFSYMFYYGYPFTHIPTIDMRNATNTKCAFSYLAYRANASTELTIDKVIVSESTPYDQTFQTAYRLKHITFEGVIGQTGLNFNWSPLSVASMKSIISCLKDRTGTEGEGVYSIKFNDACWEALEADSTAPDGGTWKDYVSAKLGWSY